jgi:polyhydroxybutyrate depolymerase
VAQPDSKVFGERTVSIGTRTGQRTALVYHPDSVGAAAPLVVVVLHGDAAQARDDYGWTEMADRDGFVVAYSNAVNQSWNAGPTCCYPHSAGVNDVGYLNELVSQLTKDDLIDRGRVYAVGFSSGASMVYTNPGYSPGSARSAGHY